MHFLAKNKKKTCFFSGKNQWFFRFFPSEDIASDATWILDVLRQNQKTQKTISLNQWFFHANNPAM
jgi:hypothetical protein